MAHDHDPATVERVAEAVFDAAAYSYESPADWVDPNRLTCWDDSQIDDDGVCDTELAIEELYGEPAQWQFADDTTRRNGTRIAIAAIDALTELGWRPPLTEQERIVLNHAAIMLSMEDTLPARYDEGVIRALLTGGRADG